jgi:sulfoxide reductase heme-binding subunit YedZ
MNPDRWLKPLLFVAALIPCAWLIAGLFRNNLGANPVETITHQTGTTALVILLITLSITPLRRFTGWTWLARLRRMSGLFAFFYAVLHFCTWLVFDHFFDWNEIVKDIAKRPYITVGFTAFCLLIPLAVTSTNKMVRRLGVRRWKRLHSLVYVIGTLAVLHFLWLVKADVREPVIYGIVLLALLCLRLPALGRNKPRSAGNNGSAAIITSR